MENVPDEIIMERVKSGDLSEMSVLFERYHILLYNFFLKMGLERETSQDLTQNLFYRMIIYKGSYKEGATVKSWIYQIARNLHNDYRNLRKKSDDIFVRQELVKKDATDDHPVFDEADYERLERAMLGLNEESRELIVLSKYQGLKYEEISSITELSVPAIKVSVHRALKQLRGIYFKQE